MLPAVVNGDDVATRRQVILSKRLLLGNHRLAVDPDVLVGDLFGLASQGLAVKGIDGQHRVFSRFANVLLTKGIGADLNVKDLLAVNRCQHFPIHIADMATGFSGNGHNRVVTRFVGNDDNRLIRDKCVETTANPIHAG